MEKASSEKYSFVRSGGTAVYETERGLIAVWGREAVQFLDGLISNDVKTLEDGQQMLAAFPNAQGRLLAVVRVLRQGERFLFETEGATREKVYQNLLRFTFAGDFFVEDLTEQYGSFEVFGELPAAAKSVVFGGNTTSVYFVPRSDADLFRDRLIGNGAISLSNDLYQTLRIENGVPLYDIDMDETTVVPELGFDDMISYNKGCYIGQEIIARIHFRGHVAKRLTGVFLSEPGVMETGVFTGAELTTPEGKNAGRVTSTTFSPMLDRLIALAFIRYDYLAEGTELVAGQSKVVVADLPFERPMK